MQVFPLPADARYQYAQRYGPATGHWGVDIMAPKGTPVLAVADGALQCTTDPKGGNVCYLTAKDGTRYYYAHLDSYEFPRSSRDRDVQAGDQIATVGNTGNAKGGPPHLHFQVSPRKGETVDPYPLLRTIDPHNLGTAPAPPVSSVTPDDQEVTKSPAQAAAGWGWLVVLWLLTRRRG